VRGSFSSSSDNVMFLHCLSLAYTLCPTDYDLPHSGLKVLTNENRGGLNLVSFDWSRFKLFSKESVQALSCERPKTAQRTLFLSFEINTVIVCK
jgi:hypothetical protein